MMNQKINTMDENRAKSHVTLVGVLHICFGALALIGAMVVLFSLNFARSFVAPEDELARQILASLGFVIPLLIGIIGLIDIFAGASLFSYQKWSRILVIIISAINCLSFPIGTAKGVYSIWALMQPEVQDMFK